MPKAQIALTPELAKAKLKIKIAEKISRLIAELGHADANEVLAMATRNPDSDDAEWNEAGEKSAAA